MLSTGLRRVAVVDHATRPVDEPLRTLGRWARPARCRRRALEADGVQREVAAPGKAEPGGLVVALGGDGTVLAALRAAAASDAPALGIACGSLGALSAVSGEELLEALDRLGRRLDGAIAARPGRTRLGRSRRLGRQRFRGRRSGIRANRRRAAADGELYVRLADGGLAVATPSGSSAYSMAAGWAAAGKELPHRAANDRGNDPVRWSRLPAESSDRVPGIPSCPA